MKCRRCKEPAVIDIRRHNAAFCAPCFVHHGREQVRRTIDDFAMIVPGERVLVAVSGGKDSLALWDLLLELGYDTDGLYLGLGIDEYSRSSAEYTRQFARSRNARLVEVDLPTAVGFGIPDGAQRSRRSPCGTCGLSKRHLFNQAALDGGYDVVATGHNLDDEAAVLFGNVMRWDAEYLGRQFPVLPTAPGFVRKVKPLVRMTEREMAAWCVIRGIDYIVEECPMAEGNRHLRYKEILNDLERRAPGSKATFVSQYFAKGHHYFQGAVATDDDGSSGALVACAICGAPTTNEVCAFCRLQERVTGQAIPVVIGARRDSASAS